MISSSLGLCLVSRPVRGSVSTTRAGLGWPTRSRAFALTALVAENFPGLRFVMVAAAQFLCRMVEYGINSPLKGSAGNHGRTGFFHRDHRIAEPQLDLPQMRAGGGIQGHVGCAAEAPASSPRGGRARPGAVCQGT